LSKPPIPKAKMPPRGRQRARADGSWRVWWEPETALRANGWKPVQLSADKPTWSMREMERLNREVDRARAGKTPARTGGRSIDAVIHRYRAEAFPDLAPKTQKSYDALLRLISAKWGEDHVSDFTKPVIYNWYQALLRTGSPRRAQALVRMMSSLMGHAELLGWRAEDSNPCLRLKMRTPKPRKRTANWDEIDALVQAADALGWPVMGQMVLFATYHGQRETDLILARRADFRRQDVQLPGDPAPRSLWLWQLTRSKRGTEGVLPVHDACAPMLDVREDLAPAEPIFADPVNDGPFNEETFQTRWQRLRATAAEGLPSVATLQFRDLRRTFGVMARSAAVGRDDIGDVLGNSAARDPLLGETYMPADFPAAMRAIGAIARPVAGPEKKKA